MKVSFTRHFRRSKISDKELYQSIKNIFGFSPSNIFLYKLAFRHRSVAQETSKGIKISNERLEYLGDAILGAVVADFLFKKFPYGEEGFLTEMRSKIVNRARLNKLSQKLGIDKLIQVNAESNNLYRSMNGDAFEAFIGALYLDKGYTFTKKIIIQRIIHIHIDIENLESEELNHKSKLIEWAQKEKRALQFNVVDEIGAGYSKQYVVEIIVDQVAICRNQDFSIKGAEQRAAEIACNQLNILD